MRTSRSRSSERSRCEGANRREERVSRQQL
jgi:hypothetical protein